MTTLFIDGEWRDASDRGVRDIASPADGHHVATVAEATVADTDAAIAAARNAFDHGPWPHTPASERSVLLHRIADRLQAERETVAALESGDTGKRLAEARMDVDDVTDAFRHFADLALVDPNRSVDVGQADIRSRVVAEPVGVCSLITPWNYPLLQTSWKVAPALAAGNTFVLKPAELTPSTAIWLIQALAEEGLPRGVANLVLGAGSVVGPTLTGSIDVDLVSFTGGLVTGRAVMASAAETVKRVSLELGGKNPNIVFADADLDAAIDNALTAVFLDSGQVCSAGARLLLEESIAGQVVPELVRRARNIRLGLPDDPLAETGPLISSAHRDKVEAYVATALGEGAELLCGGQRPTDPHLANGWFYPPTILGGCHRDMTCVRDESFGPVLTIETFTGTSRQETEAAALDLANDTIYGLAGAVWTTDPERAERIARGLRAGTVWINDYHPYVPAAEWGGYKQSGVGRELGRVGLDEYRELKHIWSNTAPAPSGWFENRST